MVEGGTRAEKETWEREFLDLLLDYDKCRLPDNPVAAVAELMIVHRDFAPWDMIELSKENCRAKEVLQLVVRWLKHNDGIVLLESPLLDWAVDVADGTLPPPPPYVGRPPKGHPYFRDYVIAVIVDEIAAIDLRPATSSKQWKPSSPLASAPSASHMVAAVLHLSPHYVGNIWSSIIGKRNSSDLL